jgi:myo-inositol-1(or 4)-monophosphatase
MLEFAIQCSIDAGKILLKHYTVSLIAVQKENISNIVTAADIESEKFIIEQIQAKYPNDGIISEEYGFINKESNRIWIVDPLDGTSNFAAGLEWFGVLIAVIENRMPVVAVAHLPAMGKTYYSQKGIGAFKNGKRISVTSETVLKNVLCSFGIDASKPSLLRKQFNVLFQLCRRVRNIRATNSLVDFCNLAEGLYGCVINFNTRIWDIVAPCLIVSEAGGKCTQIDGADIWFGYQNDIKSVLHRTYKVIASNGHLHKKLLKICKINKIEG